MKKQHASEVPWVHRVSMPTPYPIGDVNAYFLSTRVPALIDSGCKVPESWERLDRAIRKAGGRVEQLRVLVLSHAHQDHFGLAARVAETSGAEVRANGPEVGALTDFRSYVEHAGRIYTSIAREFGFPPDKFEKIIEFYRRGAELVDPIPGIQPLQDGEKLDLGDRILEVLDCPGHSSGALSLFEPRSGVLFSADTLLEGVSSNTFFRGPRESSRVGFANFRRTLERLAALRVTWVFPGHGEPFRDHVAAIDRIRNEHREREELLLCTLGGEPRTAFELVPTLFPGLRLVMDLWLAFAEVLGHLEVLEERGRVERMKWGDLIGFVRTDRGAS